MHASAWKRLGSLSAIAAVAIGLAAAQSQGMTASAEPERYVGIISTVGAQTMAIVRVKITLERYNTMEERQAYLKILKEKGSDGLVQAMEKSTVGYIQLDQNLRYPLAYAIKVPTEKGFMIRAATNRPISFQENLHGFVTKDYNIGVLEMQIPKDGAPGEGIILAATQVQFNDEGKLEVRSLPQNMGPQKVTQIEREEMKPKKD